MNHSYRSHQSELYTKLLDVADANLPLRILAYVVPGGGKSWLPGIVKKRFPGMKLAWFVPRLPLRRQAAVSMHRDFDIRIRETTNECDPSRGQDGFVATHQALSINPDLWSDELKTKPYILVIDELHHASLGGYDGEAKALASAIARLTPRVTLAMTGTLERHDRTRIYGVTYEQRCDGVVPDPKASGDIFIRYDRSTARQEGSIVPVRFFHHDGPVRFVRNGTEHRINLSEIDRDNESAGLFTALTTELADKLLEQSYLDWKANGDKFLVVTYRQEEAKARADQLRRRGLEVALAIDENVDSEADVKRFSEERNCRVLVTCQMASEGLDVPAISHIACLTRIRSSPWIEQMLARGWRAYPGKDECRAYVPDDPPMNRVIKDIKDEDPKSIGDESRTGLEGRQGSPWDGRPEVIALGSNHEFTRLTSLDGDLRSGDELLADVEPFIVEQAALMDDTEKERIIRRFAEMVRAQNRPVVQDPVSLTVAEEEARRRSELQKACSRLDALTGSRPGTHNRKLLVKYGKSRTEMNLEELDAACRDLSALGASYERARKFAR